METDTHMFKSIKEKEGIFIVVEDFFIVRDITDVSFNLKRVTSEETK